MLIIRISRHDHKLEKMLATWFLLVVPLVVISTTGGIVAQLLETVNPKHALMTVIFSSVSLIIGLTITFMFMTFYLLKLIIHGLPEKNFIVSKLIPLGPLGQVRSINID